ncbi:MAG: prolipoprotein diacylglyceryl transferase [Armatimonadota bacterium]|nr:prolipoprotein diacylglyceryl transferase [Armatimonadota bacterium]MDR7534505.1 prolipoprotein diacylglyceryl transferase [Armatimonadota bacterium]MDR7536037.1 prolipoprotein diacylglyceryl transferase [Armatimonadota bacterium]
MQQILYDVWGVPISAFGLFLLLAFFAGIVVARRVAHARLGIEPTQTLDLALYAIVAGIVGGRIGFVLANLEAFAGEPRRILTIWRDGGLVYYGALAAGLLLARLYTRRWPASFGALLDAYAPALVLGYGVAMIGALLHGLFPGKPTGVPWAIELFLERRHPTQIYLAVAAAAILVILRGQRDQALADGTLFVLAVFLQAVARFFVDVFVEAPAVAGPLTLGQLASGTVALASGLLLLWLQRRAPALGAEPTPQSSV